MSLTSARSDDFNFLNYKYYKEVTAFFIIMYIQTAAYIDIINITRTVIPITNSYHKFTQHAKAFIINIVLQ